MKTGIAVRIAVSGAWAASLAAGFAGPYSAALGDHANAYDAPVPGFVGPHGDGMARLPLSGGGYSSPENYVNPLFFGWADGWDRYEPAPGVAGLWGVPEAALGPVSGDHFDIVSLGDLSASQIGSGVPPGSITLTFSGPIRDMSGADFAVFENGFLSGGLAGVSGQVFAELAYVEVSSDGVHFARMPSVSLTPGPVGAYGTVDATNVFGLAGKHVNAYGFSWGTPFDLAWLADHPLVVGGQVDLGAITHVRIVDIPGSGAFQDSQGNPIYDAWVTIGSGGADIEAVGGISRPVGFEEWQDLFGLGGAERGLHADPDGDGIPNAVEYAAGLHPGRNEPGLLVQKAGMEGGRMTLRFRRDERAKDVKVEVEVSGDLQGWQVIARGVAGGPVEPVAPFAPAIQDAAAHAVRSVGVIRETQVSDVMAGTGKRFMRVRVTKL